MSRNKSAPDIKPRIDERHQPHRSTRLEHMGIWEWDLVTGSVFYSPDWKRLRGCEAEDILRTPEQAEQWVHPDDRAKRKKLHAQLRAGELEQIEFEHRVKWSDGSWGRVVERTHSICNNEGQPIRLVGCEVDLSLEQQEQELNQANNQPAPEFDSLPVAVVQFENNLCVFVNEYWSQLTGRSKESAFGDGWIEAIHPDDRDRLAEFRELHEEGIPGDTVVIDGVPGRHLNPDGSTNWFLAKVRLNYGMDGKVASSSIVVLDITERKKLERQQEQLVEILEATTDFIGISTPNREVLWLNQRLAELRPDLNPEDNPAVSAVHPQWATKIMAEVAFPVAIQQGSWSGKVAVLDSDKNEIPVSMVLIAHKKSDGSVESFSTIMREIGEQEKTERALRLSERNYSSLAATAPVGIFRMSDPKTCIYVNEHWGKLTGRPLEAALGQGWMDFVHPDDLEILLEKAATFAADPKQIEQDPAEAMQVLPDGSTHWVQCHLAKELDDDGNVTGYVGTLTDIDRAKRAEEELKELNRRLHDVLQVSSIGIWEWTWADERLVWDEKMHEIYGVDAEDFQGLHSDWLDRIHPDDIERIKAEDKSRVESNSFAGPSSQEFRIVRPCGEVRHIYANVHTVFDEHDKPVLTTGINVDITERRKTEFALLESENKFQRIADHAPVMVYRYVVHPDGTDELTYVSAAVREIFKIEPESALATGVWERVHPDEHERLKQEIETSARTLQPFISEYRLDLPLKGIRWVQSFAQPFWAENGDVIWDGVVFDHTQRKTIQLKLEQAQSQIERMTDHLPGLVYRYFLDADGNHGFKYLSSGVRELFGFEPSELISDVELLWQFVYPSDAERLMEKMHDSATDLSRHQEEFRVMLPDRGTRWFQANSRPKKVENGVVWDGVMLDITDRKKVEIELQDAKHQSERITENVPGMIFRNVYPKNSSPIATFISSKSLEMFGLEPAEALENAAKLWQKIHPDDLESFKESVTSSIENLEPLSAEYRVTLSNKETQWYHVTGQPEQLENGDVTLDGVVLDVTQRKSAQLALEDAKHQMERITANVPGVIYQYILRADGSGAMTFISSQCCEMYGLTSEEITDDVDLLFNLTHKEDVEKIRATIAESAKTLQPLELEYRSLPPGKGMRWHQAIGQPIRTDNGDTVWNGMVLDITDRKEMELALTDTKLQMERITENVPGVIYQHVQQDDGTFSVSFISPQCRDMFGLTPEEVMGDFNLLLNKIYPEDAARVSEATAKSASTLQPLEVEYRISLPGKGLRWHQSVGQPFRTEGNGTIWNGMVLDVTDRKEAELANDVLAKATKTKDEFIANMSHELRTPLTAILAMTDGLQQGMFGETTPKQLDSLKIVEQSGVHLLDLINEVLDLARIESGQTELEFSSIDVSELCEFCLNFVTRQAEQKQIELSLKVPWNLPKLVADEKRIRQVLINLLSNAVKFTPKGGRIKMEVEGATASTDLSSETLRISVSDTGIGITDNQLDCLFEPFVQVDSSLTRQQGGTGLGLSLVKRYVELHHGTVRVTSKLGQGSCFIVDLPFRKAHPRQVKADQNSEHSLGEHRSTSETPATASKTNSATPHEADGNAQPLILLAEDNADVALAIISILEFSDFKVLNAVNGKLAVEMAQKHSPDLIVMDIQMPVMDGLEATRKIREIPELSKLPIIAASGFAKAEDSRRCIEAGANLFMAKPLRIKELLGNIDSLLHQQKASS